MKSPYSHRGLGQDLLKNYLLTHARPEWDKPNRRWMIWLSIGLTIGSLIAISLGLKAWHRLHKPIVQAEIKKSVVLPKFEFYSELSRVAPEKYTPLTVATESTVQSQKKLANNPHQIKNKILAKKTESESHLHLNTPIPKKSGPEQLAKQKNLTEIAAQKQILHKMMTYFVQAGIFQDYQSADSLKARLAFLGFRTQINQTTDKQDPNRRLYHVTIGPLESKQVALKVKSQLEQHNIQQVTLLSRL